MTVPTTRKILATFHTILEFAISQDFIATNAVRGITVIGPRDEGSRKIVPPSKAEMRSLIESINWDARTKVIFAGATGVRAGEQWALRWSDVDLDNRQVNIRRRIDAYGREEPPKSASGVRTIPLSDHLARTLMEWRIQTGFSLEDDFVFVNKNGRHVCHDNFVKRRFKPALNRAGLSPHVNWHSLRHFAISTWIEAGLAPKTIMTFAGHTSIQLTMDRYGHMFPSDDHQVVMNVIANDLFI